MFPLLLNLNSFVSNLKKTEDTKDPFIHECFDELVESDNMCGDGSYIQKGNSSGLDEIYQVKLKNLTWFSKLVH